MQLQMLLERITSLAAAKGTLIVGIDGLGGAGKSTISAAVANNLQADGLPILLLHIDDFIHPRAVRYNEKYPEWECYYYLQWKYEELQKLLADLRQEGAAAEEVLLYDKERDCYISQQLSVPKGTIIIVEGVFLQRPELAGWFDYMVYVDVPEEIRLQRVLLRDSYIGYTSQIAEKYQRRYFPAERFYVNACQPAQRADYVLQTYKE